MEELIAVALKHPWLILGILTLGWLFSAGVSGMPMPDPAAPDWRRSPLYQWLFTSLHTLAGNAKTVLHDPRIQSLLKPIERKPDA